ncbi:MAG: cytochrome c biogenesis protein CcsA, partial [Gammaproteobacteria bacterium]|nr:cytochrome c biogenesis protein CcsA [Gammaproteobacteria bacterium]
MLAEWGTLLLALALVLCLGILILPLKYKHNTTPIGRFIQRSTLAYSACILLALGCLMLAFLRYDFTVWSVYNNANASLPWWYRLGATWGHHEGSLLLWCALLSVWSAGVALFPRGLSASTHQLVLRCLALLESGFLVFLLLTSSPFMRFFPIDVVPAQTLTPILQDPGLMFHPPMLYLGYVGFAVGFAYAIAALIEGKLDTHWCCSLRLWVGLSWAFLTLGIVLGSWWAYRELGWGGWWFWDPVENASLMPWLCATALMHSLIVTEKQQAFKGWIVALALLCFALSLLGTFLVRSGVLVSVHAFANDPSRGLFLLLFLASLWVGSIVLYVLRAHRLASYHQFELLSRETFLLLNSVVILTLLATVVLGTVYPIILDSLHLAKITVGMPYYNAVFVPIALPLLLLMAIAPMVRWRTQSLNLLISRLFAPLLGAIVATALVAVFDPSSRPLWVLAGLWVAFFIILATLLDCYHHIQKNALTLRRFAMVTAHLGIAILVLGISINKSHSLERQV